MNVQHILGSVSSMAASVTRYFAAFSGSSVETITSEGNSSVDIHSAGTASNLFCYVSAHDRGDSTLRMRINAANGNQAITITGSTTGQFEDSSNTDSLDATEAINYSVTTGAGGTTFVIEARGHLFAPSSGTVCYYGGSRSHTLSGTADRFLGFPSLGSSTTESQSQNTIAAVTTLQKAYFQISNSTRSDETLFRTRINGVNGNIVATIPATTNGEFEDATNTDTTADGDELGVMWDQGGGSGSHIIQSGKIEISATDCFPLFAVQNPSSVAATQASGLTRYNFIAGNLNEEFDDTEAHKQVKFNVACTLSDLYGFVSNYSLSGGGHSLVVRSRINGANGNLAITFTGTGQQADASNSDSVADDDEVNYSFVTGGTAGTVTHRVFSLLASLPAAALTTEYVAPGSQMQSGGIVGAIYI